MTSMVESFAFRAVNPRSSSIIRGTVEASGESAVIDKLHAQGLVPLDIHPVIKTGLRREIRLGNRRRVRMKPLALFADQLANLINAGLPLMRSVRVLVEQTDDKALRIALRAVQGDLEAGTSFSAALAKQPDAFPPLMVSLIRVGEAGGFLGDSLKMVADTYRSDVELQDKLRSASTYPLVVLVIAVLAVIGMITFIVPIFESMFTSMGGELPLPTQLLVATSHNMVWILPVLVIVSVAGWLWWMRNRRTERVRKITGPLVLRLPIFGKIARKTAVARFTRNLAMMLSAGVPLLQALSSVESTSNNWAMEQTIGEIQLAVRDGESMAAPMARSQVFPALVAQMVAVGEESGTLPHMLTKVAEMYEAEVKASTDQLAGVLEPILIVTVGIMIGSMVLALYLPIFGLYSQLAAQ